MSEDELKEALKVLVKRKEEIEGQHQATMAELDQERERVKELEKEVNKLKQELNIRGDTHSQQQQALERENDLLREQLKRYVGMVQSQNQDGGEPDNTLSTKLSEVIIA
jgi:chromosome segregation ATPase